jgi:hypothetical protein
VTDRKIKRISLGFRYGLLDGGPSKSACAVVSFALQGFLSALGLKTDLFESDLGHCNHIWLKLPDGRVLDATADQFNELFPNKRYPKVHLGEPLDIHENAKPYGMEVTR